MAAREPISLTAVNADGIGLQVRFTWQEDRHGHTISLFVGSRPIPVFESAEGSSNDVWPISPPLQQLSVEELRPATPVALLVGMAGKSHWSISVEPVPDRAAFIFDVACRSRETVEQLGSTYIFLAEHFEIDDEHEATFEVEGRALRIRCDRERPTAATIQADASSLRIVPVTINSGGTSRWRYTIELS